MPVEQIAGEYNATPKTMGDGQPTMVQTDAQGRILVSGSSTAPVSVQGYGYSSTVTFDRPNDTTAYTAGDVIGSSTSSGGAVLTFSNLGPSGGGEVFVTTSRLEIDISSITSGMTGFMLYLYSATPPSAYGDNTAFDLPSGDRSVFLQPVGLGAPVDLGATLMIVTAQINQQITVASGGALYGYLSTIGGYTPAASSRFSVTLKAIGV